MKIYFLLILFCGWLPLSSDAQDFNRMARESLDSTVRYYKVEETELFHENYPFNDDFKADYLISEAHGVNKYAYLWPFSGGLSSQVAIFEHGGSDDILLKIDRYLDKGLSKYRDSNRLPVGYASYVNNAPQSDRFYDDNIWIGIDLSDLYLQTGQKKYLDRAIEVWKFVMSGYDEKLGGGIYWCEQKKESKNTCSNAPASVFAVKLFTATKDDQYLETAKKLYHWTRDALLDSSDDLYFDNINLAGEVQKAKFSYNSGQMIQAAALLYKITKDTIYLREAESTASSAIRYFFDGNSSLDFPLRKNGNVWFDAILLRGFVELYEQNYDLQYLNVFRQNLIYAYEQVRDEHGLYSADWNKERNEEEKSKWLLNQFAMAEMFARLAKVYLMH